MSVHVGPWVLDFACLDENGWDNRVQLAHQVEHLVVGQMLEGKLTLTTVSGVSFAEHSVTIARHNLTWKKKKT